jgi:formylglycine-generating enzyme required for sulfatase activity
LPAFCIDEVEVSARDYQACVHEGACKEAHRGEGCTFRVDGREDHPINCVTWEQATAYCRFVRKTLPDDSQWEWAARGASKLQKIIEDRAARRPSAPSGALKDVCWNGAGNDLGKGMRVGTCPTGSYPQDRTSQGVHDLAGNVAEWVAWRGTCTAEGITGSFPCGFARGGAWGDENQDYNSRTGFLGNWEQGNRIGIRCVDKLSRADTAVPVEFSSTPPGAGVRIDGRPLCPATPCLRHVVPGLHQVSMKRAGHGEVEARVQLAEGASVALSIPRNVATVEVNTNPPRLPVQIAGRRAGFSPLKLDVPPGALEAGLDDPCWEAQPARLTLVAGDVKALTLEGRPRMTELMVTARGANEKMRVNTAQVIIDGAPVGKSGEKLAVPSCARRMQVVAEGLEWKGKLSLERLPSAAVEVILAPARCPMGMSAVSLIPSEVGPESVRLFCLDDTEVSVGAFKKCVDAGSCPAPPSDGTVTCNLDKTDRLDHAMNCVTRAEARLYCKWMKRRLPAPEELVSAARQIGGNAPFPWGSDSPENRVCWNGPGNDLGAGGRRGTCPVGGHPRGDSPQLISDLAGNVSEWTSASEGFLGAKAVYMGGHWYTELEIMLTPLTRYTTDPEKRSPTLGFRCAGDLTPSPPSIQ